MSDFSLLKTKEILEIFNGDKEFGNYKNKRLAMPYLSGPKICDISNSFGLIVKYPRSDGASRWQYMESLIEFCIKNNKIKKLILFLFNKNQFRDILKDVSPKDIVDIHKNIVNTVIEQINSLLYFDGKELVFINNDLVIKTINSTIILETPKMNIVDREYIKNLVDRAQDDIQNGNFDSALTKSRTLVEEVFIYAIEQKNQNPEGKGDIKKLYKQVKELYSMHTSKDIDTRINMLLSGIEKILTSISEMRNENSDSHGAGMKRVKIREHHALLFLNSAIALSDFILAVAENNKTKVNEGV